MFQIGFTEVSIIVVVLLITLGPKRLPKMLAYLKLGIKKFRSISTQIQDNVESVLNEKKQETLQPERIVVQNTEVPPKSVKK